MAHRGQHLGEGHARGLPREFDPLCRDARCHQSRSADHEFQHLSFLPSFSVADEALPDGSGSIGERFFDRPGVIGFETKHFDTCAG
jgi:hypothetical protein